MSSVLERFDGALPAVGSSAGPSPADPRQLLLGMFHAAVDAAQPALRLRDALPAPPKGRTVVIGAGKASAAMAQVLEAHWPTPLEGVVVTRYGHGVPCRSIEILEAAHPVPDQNGLRAAQRIMACVQGLTADDLVICLISGGGSALLPLPAPGISLQDKQVISQQLLEAGATISEINCVRRHLSAVKGGHLAAACHPAPICNLVISDVPADHLSDIASGPTVPDASTSAQAMDLLVRYGIQVPPAVSAALAQGRTETIKPGSASLPQIQNHLVATPQQSLEAAAAYATGHGLNAYILGDAVEGEAREVGKVMAAIARQVRLHGQPFKPPCVLLSGGETTVTVRGNGRGGRNVEFLLSLGIALGGMDGVHAIACDTDGIDGREEIAGATLAPDSLTRALALGVRAAAALQDNDGHGFFGCLGDAVVTGPTHTNVNDFRAIYIGA
ncbi:hydroxypyruvate reductase [Pseudoxanthomonas sp. GM95]|uniref:glycerate kinase type-2 family protein n=1 Tax=Pseudoxanthomonas sp. GM95 TaxID=1881043 RepID=UPI0008C7B30C|nr:glycerate kinase [Pseudoxanthomonas sp. GM95]SEL17457.1 hydroxypyruvate reductase [Pseudoxanthomonas sp. GM95]